MDTIKDHSIDQKIEEIYNVSEPETFDTWTIITDPLNNLNKSETNGYNNGNRIEILKDNVEVKENYTDRTEIKYEKVPENIDELSDGISIISDCESAGRSSPIPLYDSDRNYYEKENNEFVNKTSYETIITSISTKQNLSEATVNRNVNNCVNRCCQDISYENNKVPITKISPSSSSVFTIRNISLIFYISVSIAIVGFVGKIKYPEWGNTLQEEVINQRVGDLELQNNLLRAEIDILSKQVQYLNKETEMHSNSFTTDSVKKHNDNTNYIKKEKIKVWPGNGRIQRTEIPKEALKLPHSCDQSDENTEGVCIDSTSNTEENKNSDLHSQQFESKDLKNIIIESIEKIIPVAFPENLLNNYKNDDPKNKNDNVKFNQHDSQTTDQKKRKKYETYNRQNQQHRNVKDINQTNDKIPENNMHDKWEKPNKKENYKNKVYREDFRNRETHTKEQDSVRNINNDKRPDNEIRNEYDSTEKSNKKNKIKNMDYHKDFENNSNEKHHKNNNKYKKKINDFEKSDEYNNHKKQNNDWHENMMKNREEYRKQHNDKWKSNNWYMDRASGREEARLFEKDQQKFKKMRRQ